jgi:hypothetical protein
VTVEDMLAGFVDNTATATADEPDGTAVTSEPDTAHAALVLQPAPSIPAGPKPASPTPTTQAEPIAPTGGSVATGRFGMLPWVAACGGLIALAGVGIRRTREERAS